MSNIDTVNYLLYIGIINRHGHILVHNIAISDRLMSNIGMRLFALYVGIVDRHGHLLVHTTSESLINLSNIDALNYLLSM
jgi:hypothetical protein